MDRLYFDKFKPLGSKSCTIKMFIWITLSQKRLWNLGGIIVNDNKFEFIDNYRREEIRDKLIK